MTMPEVAVGVDVGEDFLDLAVISAKPLKLRYHRVPLCGIEDDPLEILRKRLLACCPDAGLRFLALIDSPRWPRDLDCSQPAIARRDPVPTGRTLDGVLRQMLRASPRHSAMRLSMFPTPPLQYFRQCARNPACKPHLRSVYHRLFESEPAQSIPRHLTDAVESGRGGNFTRFMLAGFIAFAAWDSLDVRTLEAYPDLQFRLWSDNRLAPKGAGKRALMARVAINRRLRTMLGIAPFPLPANLDQADAEILASSAMLAAKQRSLRFLEHPAEGRFLLTFRFAK
jgi:hypothetical protein